MDFDQDGIEELIIGYSIPYYAGLDQECTWPYLDVWRLEDGEPVLAYEGARLRQSDIGQHCAFTVVDGKYYLLDGMDFDISGGTDITLLTLVNGEFIADTTMASEEAVSGSYVYDVTYTVNGIEVDEETFRQTYNKIKAGYPYYYPE